MVEALLPCRSISLMQLPEHFGRRQHAELLRVIDERFRAMEPFAVVIDGSTLVSGDPGVEYRKLWTPRQLLYFQAFLKGVAFVLGTHGDRGRIEVLSRLLPVDLAPYTFASTHVDALAWCTSKLNVGYDVSRFDTMPVDLN